MSTKRALILSLIFSIILTTIPWEELNGGPFRDKLVYLDYAEYGINKLNYLSFDTFFSYITNEWLWHYIILNINTYMPYIVFFNAISFLSLFSISFFLLKRHSIYSLLLIINPLVIDLVMSQYRMSLAMSLILIAIHLNKLKKLKIFMIGVAALIHTSVILFIVTYLGVLIAQRFVNRSSKIYLLYLITMGMLISFILSGFVDVILESVGDRRSDYPLEKLSSSLTYLSFWVLNFIFIVLYYLKRPIKKMSDSISIVVLSNITFNLVFGGYSTRILATMFPVIMDTNLRLGTYYKFLLFMVYILYTYLQWVYWLNY